MCVEEDLDLKFEEVGYAPPPLQRPKALRPSVPDTYSNVHHPSFASGEHTPRVAAARRDLYARVNDHAESNKPIYDLPDQNTSAYHHHHLDSILSRPDTASGGSAHTSAAVSCGQNFLVLNEVLCP